MGTQRVHVVAVDCGSATRAGRLADGTLGVDIEATYALDRIKDAMEHAGREGRGGKILLTPN